MRVLKFKQHKPTKAEQVFLDKLSTNKERIDLIDSLYELQGIPKVKK